MSHLRELYRAAVLEHSKNPRNFGKVDHASHKAEGSNPLCGDDAAIYLDVRDDVIHSIGWTGNGCAVFTASASIMSEMLLGKTQDEAIQLIHQFIHFIQHSGEDEPLEHLGNAEVLAGVKEFPVRVKCALLGWKTTEAALMKQQETVTTEAK